MGAAGASAQGLAAGRKWLEVCAGASTISFASRFLLLAHQVELFRGGILLRQAGGGI